MYFYVFIVMYVTIRFSNGLLFKNPPLNENMKLTNSASSALERFFQFLTEEKTMGYPEFTKLLNDFNWIHQINDREIEKLFEEESISKDVIMNFDQFKKLATKYIIQLENCIEVRFKVYSNYNEVLNVTQLILALQTLEIPITPTNVKGILTTLAGSTYVDMKLFRSIFTYVFHVNSVEFMTNRPGGSFNTNYKFFDI